MGIQINGQTDTVTAADGSLNLGGNVTIPGVLTYEDVTSVDAVGLSTFQNGIHVTGGLVGIGTDNPAAELEVYGNARFKDIDGSHGIEFYPDVASLGYQRIISYNRTTSAYENLSIGVNDFVVTTGSSSERLRITSSGNVGIGTNTSLTDILTINDTNPKISIRDAGTERAFIEVDSSDNLVINNKSISNLIFETSDSERLRITSSGTIGIGTIPKTWTSGYNVLQVGSASLVGQSEQDGQTTNWSNNAYFDVNNNRWEYSFADQASQITQSDGLIIFRTASTGTANAALSWTESARFNTSGNLAFPSGQGIDFSATADGGTTTPSELLDDYEEGTWTPNFTNVTYTPTVQFGRYTKIGRYVYCTITIDGSISNGSGDIGLEGLPFSADEASDNGQRSTWKPANGGHHVGLSINDARFRVNGSTMQGVKGATGSTTYMSGNQLTSGTFQFTGDFSYYTSS